MSPIIKTNSLTDLTGKRRFYGSLRDLEKAQRLSLLGFSSEQIEEMCREDEVKRETELVLGMEKYMECERRKLDKLNREQERMRNLAARRKEIEAELQKPKLKTAGID